MGGGREQEWEGEGWANQSTTGYDTGSCPSGLLYSMCWRRSGEGGKVLVSSLSVFWLTFPSPCLCQCDETNILFAPTSVFHSSECLLDSGDHGNGDILINAHVVEFGPAKKQNPRGPSVRETMDEGGGGVQVLGEEEQGEVSRNSSREQ